MRSPPGSHQAIFASAQDRPRFRRGRAQRRDALPRFILAQGLRTLGGQFLKPAMSAGGALAKLVAQSEKGSARDDAIVGHT
jgi:hypothetical protein